MKKILVLLICFLLTGCFEVTERVTHHDNDSGEYSLVIDFSKSWFRTRSAIWLEEVDGVSIPSEKEIKEKLENFQKQALQIEGIDNVITKHDFNNYIFTFKLQYKRLESLNLVLNLLNEGKSIAHFLRGENNFQRNASYPIPNKILKDEEKKEDLLDAHITTIYCFDQPIKKSQNTFCKFSKNKKVVFLKQTVYDFLKNNSVLNNTIYF